MLSLDSAFALELKKEPKNGIVGAALRTVDRDTGRGCMPKNLSEDAGWRRREIEKVRSAVVRFWRRIRMRDFILYNKQGLAIESMR